MNTETTAKKVWDGLRRHRGSLKDLAARCQRTEEWVRLVLSGKGKDDALIYAGAALLHELETTRSETLARAADLVNRAEALATA